MIPSTNNIHTADTAVLLFSLSSHEEAKRKPIFGDDNVAINRKLWSTLKKHCIKCAELAGLAIIVDSTQEGNSFGQKLAFSVENCFELGYNNLIIIAVDNPSLSAKTLKESAKILQTKDWVIEPAEDGGINLIGIKKENFQFDNFSLLPWQKDNLVAEFVGQTRSAKQSLSILESQQDFDSKEDLHKWLEASPNKVLSLVIKGLLFKESYEKANREIEQQKRTIISIAPISNN